MSVQPETGAFCNSLRESAPGMFRSLSCAEAALRLSQRQQQQAPDVQGPSSIETCLPPVKHGVNVDVIVFCDGIPQMKCTAKLGSKAFTHSVSTWYLYSVPPMLRKQLRKLQQSPRGYGFEVVQDPITGDVKVVHLTYHTKPLRGKDEPAALRLTTYTDPMDGTSAVVEYARNFKAASRKRKHPSLPASSKAIPPGSKVRMTSVGPYMEQVEYSSPIPSQSASPTSPYFTRSPSISSDCTTDRIPRPVLPGPNMSNAPSSHHTEVAWEIKEETLVPSNASVHVSSSGFHTSSITEMNDSSRGHMSTNCSAQPTPSSLAHFTVDDGYTSQASSHTTPAPSPLVMSSQQHSQALGVRNDSNRSMPPPQRCNAQLAGGHHRLLGGLYEHLSSNSSNTVLPKSMDTTGSPASGECSDDDVDPGVYATTKTSSATQLFPNNLVQLGGNPNSQLSQAMVAASSKPQCTTLALGATRPAGLSPGLHVRPDYNGPVLPTGSGARKLQPGSTIFNFKPHAAKSYDPDATVHGMYLPKPEPGSTIPAGPASRLPNLRPVHIPSALSGLPGMLSQHTVLDDWFSQAVAASGTPTPNSGMAAQGQLPQLFDAGPDSLDNLASFARSQCCVTGQLPSLADLLDLNQARTPGGYPSPIPLLGGPLSASHMGMWGEDGFPNEVAARGELQGQGLDLDSLLNTGSWGQSGPSGLQ